MTSLSAERVAGNAFVSLVGACLCIHTVGRHTVHRAHMYTVHRRRHTVQARVA